MPSIFMCVHVPVLDQQGAITNCFNLSLSTSHLEAAEKSKGPLYKYSKNFLRAKFPKLTLVV
jgi:hypothetical protein